MVRGKDRLCADLIWNLPNHQAQAQETGARNGRKKRAPRFSA